MRVYSDADGTAIPRSLGGATVEAVIRLGPTALSDPAPDNFRATITQASQGVATISLPRDHALPAGAFYYEVDVQYADNARETVLAGSLTVRPSLFRQGGFG